MCVVDSRRAVWLRGPWLSFVPELSNGHKPGKYAGSAYAQKQIAGEKKTALKARDQARPAEQHSYQADRALSAIPSGLMGMSYVLLMVCVVACWMVVMIE